MSRWRIGRGWSGAQLARYLEEVRDRPVNFAAAPEDMTARNGWTIDGIRRQIAREPAGPPVPDGPFLRARAAVVDYGFSDRRIVVGHFDRSAPLLGRDMLLEIKVFGLLRFLGGVRVTDVRDERDAARTHFGFRYDTLDGHFERDCEWFRVAKEHATGRVTFEIEARWRLGAFPTWWARVGFFLVGEKFREAWRRLAVRRMRRVVGTLT